MAKKVIEKLINDPLMPLRHSAEHVLHTAMHELYPEIKLVMGPPIDDGFYFDFDLDTKISPEDFEKIEKRMQEIIDAKLDIKMKEVTADEAAKLFQANQYKLNTLEEIKERGEKITVCIMGDEAAPRDLDLCMGHHIENTSEIKAFKLLSVAGAYYKGDEKNKMLQRIYGTAFDSIEKLNEYLEKLEEAKQSDHRKLGQELDLFVFADIVGKGLPLFTEKGATIWRELERYVVDEEIANDYKHVKTPELAKTDLFKKSGHYPYYADTMYPTMQYDEEELILRPMTCPHHFMLFKSKVRSYKELPLRFAEIASLFRYEKSGTLTGLLRVRKFCLADSHNFVEEEKAADEVKLVLKLIKKVTATVGLIEGKDYIYRLSLGDRSNKEKYYDAPAKWDYGEALLRKVLQDEDLPFYEAEGEAAFYGPKIDIQMKNVLGKEDTAFTVQYDFVLPERFELRYVDSKGELKQPIVIHRSSIGALERIMGFLIEKYKGAFPVWLAPIQAVIIPIGEKHVDYAKKLALDLKNKHIRVSVNDADATMGAKIREAQNQKVPYMLIIGDREVEKNQVSVRLRTGEDLGALDLADVTSKIEQKYLDKSLDLW